MEHNEWVTQATKGDSARAIGKKAKVSFRTIYDQIERGRISAENVIAIAIGYGHHPVTALVDCGYLDAEYANTADPVAALRQVSEDDLADEVLRRMKLAGDHTALSTPLDELVEQRAQSVDDSEMGATVDDLLPPKVNKSLENGDQYGDVAGA